MFINFIVRSHNHIKIMYIYQEQNEQQQLNKKEKWKLKTDSCNIINNFFSTQYTFYLISSLLHILYLIYAKWLCTYEWEFFGIRL